MDARSTKKKKIYKDASLRRKKNDLCKMVYLPTQYKTKTSHYADSSNSDNHIPYMVTAVIYAHKTQDPHVAY